MLSTDELVAEFREVRRRTCEVVSTLEVEDFVIQPAEFTSPPRWHLAHTTWFFEIFLSRAIADYRYYDERYLFHFNSYYEGLGARVPRPERGRHSRPTVAEIVAYRHAIEERVVRLLRQRELSEVEHALFRIGLEHERQHQELLVWDIKYALTDRFVVPFRAERPPTSASRSTHVFGETLVEIGAADAAFSWDNERPRHKVYLSAFEIESSPVTMGEYLGFIEDGGYRSPLLWLSDGWKAVESLSFQAPLYWESIDGTWHVRDLLGQREVNECRSEPVSHISYFEADAFARWKGMRLPLESEWEYVCTRLKVDPQLGTFYESGTWRPECKEWNFGLWEWTSSDYAPYPGFRCDFREYNDKWFSGQRVLRGGSYATPRAHYRHSYRNFFYPHERWIGTGFRCARSCE